MLPLYVPSNIDFHLFSLICRLGIGSLSKKGLEATGHAHGILLITIGYLITLALTLAAHRHTSAIEAYIDDKSLLDEHVRNILFIIYTYYKGVSCFL